jgi:diadenosine tetraphosphate (Ap4A) HIT family hydrolase
VSRDDTSREGASRKETGGGGGRLRFDGLRTSETTSAADASGATCVFCDRAALEIVLAETEHFFVLADNAPLVEGHMLIVPRQHYACFGAVPSSLDEELLALKALVARFCAETYRPASFFEHGVFGQSVPHAHLHAVPLGPSGLRIYELATPAGLPAASPTDVRAWYDAHGHYFYLESPPDPPDPAAPFATIAAVFPPHEGPYGRVLAMLRERSHVYNPWQPQFMRRLHGGPKMRALAEKWHARSRGASEGA